MELNLKKNLFRYGKNESLTFGVIVALVLFDILIWRLISMGMTSVDYSFAKEHNCRSQVDYVLNHDIPRFEYYSPKTGKYCALFQKEYDKVRSNDSVTSALNNIKQTEDKINQLEKEIREARYTLEGNATAYNLAIQEQKGLDLSYTENIKQIQINEQELEQAKKHLNQQKQDFNSLPEVKQLIHYTKQNKSNIFEQYTFITKVDLFLTYIFAMLYIVVLIPVFMLLRKSLIRKEKYIRLLLVNHIILVGFLQGVFITISFILHILPETLLHNLITFFEALHLMALWYYIAIGLLFLLFAGVVYFLQTKGRRKNLYKKLIKGKCWSCGAQVLDNEFCFSCGEKQLCTCPHCHQKTYIKMPYCRFCGKEITEEE